MIDRIKQHVTNWINGLRFPFDEPDWPSKMWLIAAIGFILTPFVQAIALKGWKVELVRRIGVGEPRVLPPTNVDDIFRYFGHGIKLWVISGIYIAIPWILLRLLGASPFALIYEAITSIGGYAWNSLTGKPNLETFSAVLWAQFWNVVRALLYNGAWLIFYYPYVKVASLRYALTGKIRKSHGRVRANIAYMVKGHNFWSLLLMIWHQILDKISLFIISLLLSLILTPFFTALIFPLLFYVDFWTSGYDQGKKARKMAIQEYPHLLVTAPGAQPQAAPLPDEPQLGGQASA